ncbi:MAG: hypothetical protein JWR22_3370, partial [Herminiimonas sp.]|nr:hypothetical protein [Herminiimonas sp.]
MEDQQRNWSAENMPTKLPETAHASNDLQAEFS